MKNQFFNERKSLDNVEYTDVAKYKKNGKYESKQKNQIRRSNQKYMRQKCSKLEI